MAVLAFGLLAALMPVNPAPQAVKAAPAVSVLDVPGPSPEVLTDVVGAPAIAHTVALTFDDGPDPRWTPQVLAALHRHGAVATFCMVGEQARAHPELVSEVVKAGMRLCDHSSTHDAGLPFLAPEQMLAEIVGGQEEIAAPAAARVSYFRAPAGNWSPAVVELATSHAMHSLGWSVDPRDWRQPGASAIVAAVQRQVHPGAVVLLHDGGGDRSQTVEALEQLLPWLTAHCYRFGFPTP